MYTPHSLEIALLMMITSAICWGSWANTFKGVKNYRFELFYWDYALGIFLISLILAFTMGSTSASDPASFLNNVHSADSSNIVYMLIAGAIFNLANLLLVAGIDMAGLGGRLSDFHRNRSGGWSRLRVTPCNPGAILACWLRAWPAPWSRSSSTGKPTAVSPARPLGVEEEHRYLHCLRSSHGTVGAVRDSRHDAWKPARALQRRRVPHSGRAALLLDLECLLHEEAAGR